jgi:hypothetical protein
VESIVRTHSPEPLLLRTKGTSWVALPDGGTNRHRAHRAKPNSGIHLRDSKGRAFGLGSVDARKGRRVGTRESSQATTSLPCDLAAAAEAALNRATM